MHLTRVHRTQGIPPDQPSPPAKGALDPEGGTWDPPTWENVFFHFFAAIFFAPKIDFSATVLVGLRPPRPALISKLAWQRGDVDSKNYAPHGGPTEATK